jgi:hypothetical protein
MKQENCSWKKSGWKIDVFSTEKSNKQHTQIKIITYICLITEYNTIYFSKTPNMILQSLSLTILIQKRQIITVGLYAQI